MFNRCADCSSRRRPLKWYKMWETWLCHQCKETRIRIWMGENVGFPST